jgi:hypothetical protein
MKRAFLICSLRVMLLALLPMLFDSTVIEAIRQRV